MNLKNSMMCSLSQSSIYYLHYYRKPITSKWQDTYIIYYHYITEDSSLTVANAKEMEQQVSVSIRKDLRARLLDIIVAAVSEVKGDNREEEEEDDEDIEEGDEDQN